MGFASAYLKERTIFPELIEEAPDNLTGIIVVIPSYNEPGIGKVLDSLALCREPECKVEVIVVINAPDSADEESVKNNKVTLDNIESWKKDNYSCFFRLFAFIAATGTFKGWGVGLARKTGMDEAVRRFDYLQKPDGVILNLDADCLVEPDYFESVYRELYLKKI
jgi:glycosyltransferase involved in cell wall biosynthesis